MDNSCTRLEGERGRGSTSFYCFLFAIWRSNFEPLLSWMTLCSIIRPKRHCLKFEVSLDARGRGQDTRLNHDFFTWFKPRLNWSSNLNQNSSVWKSDHCFVGCSVGGRGSRRVSVGGEEGVSHISVAPKPASREDFDRFFVSISERFWHRGTSNFDIRAISVIDDFSVWVKKNLVTNKVFEPALCAGVRTFIAFWTGSVRLQWGFESDKEILKRRTRQRKTNRKLGPQS